MTGLLLYDSRVWNRGRVGGGYCGSFDDGVECGGCDGGVDIAVKSSNNETKRNQTSDRIESKKSRVHVNIVFIIKKRRETQYNFCFGSMPLGVLYGVLYGVIYVCRVSERMSFKAVLAVQPVL